MSISAVNVSRKQNGMALFSQFTRVTHLVSSIIQQTDNTLRLPPIRILCKPGNKLQIYKFLLRKCRLEFDGEIYVCRHFCLSLYGPVW